MNARDLDQARDEPPQTVDNPSFPAAAVAHFGESNSNDARVREALMRYRPVNVLPSDWNRVKDFCRQAVLAYGPPTPSLAGHLMSTTTLFVLWATTEEHAPLDYDGVFHPSLMGRYLRMRVSDKKSGAFKTLRSRLFRVASAVTSVDHHKTKRDTAFVPVHEYNAGELAELEGWAATQNTEERRRYAYITLALMGGAGLSMSEALGVRGIDVRHDAVGYTVRVEGRRPRTIPVHSEWARYLDEPRTHFNNDEYLLFNGQTPGGRATTLRRLYRGPHPAPNPQWLRDTWLLQLLRTLPFSIAMQAVGTSDVVRFQRYLEAAHLDFHQWHEAVRNPAAYGASMANTADGGIANGDSAWCAAPASPRDDVEAVNAHLGDEHRNASADQSDDCEDADTYGDRTGRTAPAQRHREFETENARLDEDPNTARRPRRRDPAKFNDYRRRPPRNSSEQTLTTDSTVMAAGTPAVPFKRTPLPEQHDGVVRQRIDGEKHAPRRAETECTPKPPAKKSLYEALPPHASGPSTTDEDVNAALFDNQSGASASHFEALRAALLAEARQSARGRKR